MTQATIQNATALLYEITNLPEPERTDYVKMMRYAMMGLRLAERAQTDKNQGVERREGA